MQAVHLQLSHQVDLLENKIFAEEMADHIEHQAPVDIAGSILDLAASDAAFVIRRLQLKQRLHGIESTCDTVGLDADALALHRQFVSTLAGIFQHFGTDLDANGRTCLFVGSLHLQRAAFQISAKRIDGLTRSALAFQAVSTRLGQNEIAPIGGRPLGDLGKNTIRRAASADGIDGTFSGSDGR